MLMNGEPSSTIMHTGTFASSAARVGPHARRIPNATDETSLIGLFIIALLLVLIGSVWAAGSELVLAGFSTVRHP